MRLQGIGIVNNTIEAKDLKVGAKTLWNYGYTETVTSVEFTKSGKSIKVGIVCDDSGYGGVRTLRSDRLVALA